MGVSSRLYTSSPGLNNKASWKQAGSKHERSCGFEDGKDAVHLLGEPFVLPPLRPGEHNQCSKLEPTVASPFLSLRLLTSVSQKQFICYCDSLLHTSLNISSSLSDEAVKK